MANQVKVSRTNALILRELSLILRDEVKDPAVKTVTVTAVECTNDLSIAKVYVSFMEHNKRSMDVRTFKRLYSFKIIKNITAS